MEDHGRSIRMFKELSESPRDEFLTTSYDTRAVDIPTLADRMGACSSTGCGCEKSEDSVNT